MDKRLGMKMVAGVMRALVRVLFSLPDGLLRRAFGNPPPEASGLSPDAWALARITAPAEGRRSGYEPREVRKESEFLSSVVGLPVPDVSTQDLTLTSDGRSLTARLYTPSASPLAGPMLIHFHGGGWVQGSIRSHDQSCARMAREAAVRVLSIEYRLAPEHPFPAQADDALLAWRSVMNDPTRFGADPNRIGVSGDSAGAQMAAVLCLDLKAAGEAQPACQILIYPVTDCAGTFASRRTFASGYYLTKKRMDWFDECFIEPGEEKNPRISPLYAEDLSGLAPALVSVALADPLLDEGVAYAERLMEAGVPTTLDHLPMLHAWFNMTSSRSSRHGHEVLAGRINQLLG